MARVFLGVFRKDPIENNEVNHTASCHGDAVTDADLQFSPSLLLCLLDMIWDPHSLATSHCFRSTDVSPLFSCPLFFTSRVRTLSNPILTFSIIEPCDVNALDMLQHAVSALYGRDKPTGIPRGVDGHGAVFYRTGMRSRILGWVFHTWRYVIPLFFP